MSNTTIVDILIANIKTDQKLLAEIETNIEQVKDEKRAITSRLKDYQKDVSVLLKYADETKKKELEALGFDFSETSHGMNPIASFVLGAIVKAKNNQMHNGELYQAYVKSCEAKKQDSVNYTEFNIKCRGLFNTQRLLRKKGKDPKNSREDMISLNGRVLQTPTEKSKTK